MQSATKTHFSFIIRKVQSHNLPLKAPTVWPLPFILELLKTDQSIKPWNCKKNVFKLKTIKNISWHCRQKYLRNDPDLMVIKVLQWTHTKNFSKNMSMMSCSSVLLLKLQQMFDFTPEPALAWFRSWTK